MVRVSNIFLLGLFVCVVYSQTLIFEDDFKTFDLKTWKHEITLGGGGNWEFEWYTNNRSNSYVRDGTLYINPTLTAEQFGSAEVQNGFTLDLWGTQLADVCTGNAFYGCERTSGAGGNILNPIQSARIRTAESFNFKYGTVEVRAKLPKGDWLWPAIWMLPRYNSYGAWPASGEFDIVESRGNSASYSAGGVNTFGSTLHWGPYAGQDKYPSTHAMYKLPSGDFSQDFHVFGLVWNESIIYTYVDSPSNIVLKVDTSSESFYNKGGFSSIGASNPWEGSNINAPFDQEFFLVFDLAVGGTGGYFPDGMGNKPWSDTSSSAVNQFYSAINQWYPTWKDSGSLQIDYVKVYSW